MAYSSPSSRRWCSTPVPSPQPGQRTPGLLSQVQRQSTASMTSHVWAEGRRQWRAGKRRGRRGRGSRRQQPRLQQPVLHPQGRKLDCEAGLHRPYPREEGVGNLGRYERRTSPIRPRSITTLSRWSISDRGSTGTAPSRTEADRGGWSGGAGGLRAAAPSADIASSESGSCSLRLLTAGGATPVPRRP